MHTLIVVASATSPGAPSELNWNQLWRTGQYAGKPETPVVKPPVTQAVIGTSPEVPLYTATDGSIAPYLTIVGAVFAAFLGASLAHLWSTKRDESAREIAERADTRHALARVANEMTTIVPHLGQAIGAFRGNPHDPKARTELGTHLSRRGSGTVRSRRRP